MTLTAHFDGRFIVPHEPVNLPQGRALEVSIREVEPGGKPLTTLQKLADLALRVPAGATLPPDFAAEHDHYLHGVPKRTRV